MATVRINQSHRDYARNRISESFQKRINALLEKQHQLELQEKMKKIEAEHKLQMKEARDLTNRKIEG